MTNPRCTAPILGHQDDSTRRNCPKCGGTGRSRPGATSHTSPDLPLAIGSTDKDYSEDIRDAVLNALDEICEVFEIEDPVTGVFHRAIRQVEDLTREVEGDPPVEDFGVHSSHFWCYVFGDIADSLDPGRHWGNASWSWTEGTPDPDNCGPLFPVQIIHNPKETK